MHPEFSVDKLFPKNSPKSLVDCVSEQIEAVQAVRTAEIEKLGVLGGVALIDSTVVRMLDMRCSFLSDVKSVVATYDGMLDASRRSVEYLNDALQKLSAELASMDYSDVLDYGIDLLAVQKDLIETLNRYNDSRQSY